MKYDYDLTGNEIILPCKKGDTYYEVGICFYNGNNDDIETCVSGCQYYHQASGEWDECCCMYSCHHGDKPTDCMNVYKKKFNKLSDIVKAMENENIGRTMFLDKEEAEAVLEEMKKKKDYLSKDEAKLVLKRLGLGNNNMLQKLVDAISEDSVVAKEEFLGYQISADILEDLEIHLLEAAKNMSIDELEKFYIKYGIGKYGIKIDYSWGDDEPLILAETKEDAWNLAMKMALKEMCIVSEENETSVNISFNSNDGIIVLYYPYDDSEETYCTYELVHMV